MFSVWMIWLKLIDLNLSGNLLTLIDDNKVSCQLNFGHKQIDRSLNVDTFNSLTNLHTLKLDHNQLTCIEMSRRHLVVLVAWSFSSFEQKHVAHIKEIVRPFLGLTN